MEFSLNAAMNASQEIADSIHYSEGLRLATVDTRPSSTPMANAPSIANYTGPDGTIQAWRRSEPDAFAPATIDGKPNTQFSYFSAACYLFGRDLYRQMDKAVPIGLVASDVGGVKIETLMSAEALLDESCGGTAYATSVAKTHRTTQAPPLPESGEEVKASAGAGAGAGAGTGAGLGEVWNGMIYPLLPMRFAGVVFYQGESNSLSGCPSAYACLFPSLISDWRAKFDLPDLSFLFVQLAAYGWCVHASAWDPACSRACIRKRAL
jgi:sialate O-acetylesterase